MESECEFPSLLKKRWILKPDYLTACNEAGKFLEEEPFEWHGQGLNIGDTISLDAPRKWRQLKQRTGYGAFYGMQVIIYGECIAPTLVRLIGQVVAFIDLLAVCLETATCFNVSFPIYHLIETSSFCCGRTH